MSRGPHTFTAVARRGFSLLELVVVLGIILVLVGLVMAVSGSLTANAERRAVEQSFKILDSAVQAWQHEMGREMTFRRTVAVTGFTTDPTALDHDGNTNTPQITLAYDVVEVAAAQADTQSRTFLDALMLSEEARNVLAALPEKTLRNAGFNATTQQPIQELVDPWGKPIRVVFPGRKWGEGTGPDTAPASARDADGTVSSSQEILLGPCLDRRIRFVSAGPDGAWGDVSTADHQATMYKISEDNIESYDTR